MTNIILHGILAQEFGVNFKMKIYKAANVIKAIDANRKNFNKRIFELSKEGLNYTMIVDGKKITELEELNIQREPNEIHLVPLIVGSGFTAVGAAIISVGSLGTVSFASASAMTFMGVSVAGVVGSIAATAVSIGLQMLLSPKPDAVSISASTKALSDSFGFSSKTNVASQGSPVPIGFGRLKVGAQIIQISMKSYPQSQESTTAMQLNYFDSDVMTDKDIAQTTSNRI